MSTQALQNAANAADKAKANAADDDEENNTPAADGTVKVYILEYEGKPADEPPYTRFSLARKAVKTLIDDGKTVAMRTARAKVSKQVSVSLA